MKVIFLDFDGVLNSSGYSASLFEAGKPTKDEYGQELFDPETVNLLNRIVDETEAKIVISSSDIIDCNSPAVVTVKPKLSRLSV